jgi:DNA-binding winged helix-turn-helix (wHTH) protein/tetratricopeptide (TPR) repeat protein
MQPLPSGAEINTGLQMGLLVRVTSAPRPAIRAMQYARGMPTQYILADLHIDLDTRCVERGGARLEVAGLSFDLLACLLDRGGAVVTFDELIAAVWAPTIVSDETVTQRVKLLRQALGDDGRRPRYIRSVRGRGYQLTANPKRTEITIVATTTGAALDALPPTHRWPRTRAVIPASAASLVIAVVCAVWLGMQPADPSPQSELLTRARYYASIGQKENNERAIALYEQALRQSPDLSAATVGLSAAYSARVCLYNFPTQWLDRAEALARGVLRAEPRNARAYMSLAYAEDCRGFIDAAIRDYEHAASLDSRGRVDALASVAYLYGVKGRLVDALRTSVLLARDGAKFRYFDIQVARALELLGFTNAAEQRYSRSFQLYPDSVFSNAAWPRFLMNRGRFIEARTALDEALSRGTDRNDLRLIAGELALIRGDRGVAAKCFEQASAMRPQSSFPATLALLYGPVPPQPARLYERIEAVKRSIEAGDRWPDNWLEIAVIQNALDDAPAAIAALGRAVDAGFLDKAYLQTSPLFQSLTAQPGFNEVLGKLSRRVEEQRRALIDARWASPDLRVAMEAL